MTALGNIPGNHDLRSKNHAHPTGVVLPFAANPTVDANGELTTHPGWLICRGHVVSSGTFPALDAIFGAAAPAGMVHAFNGGGAPSAGNFRLPNLQRAIPLHKAASGVGSTIGGPAGGGAFGSGWDHSHVKNTLSINDHVHSVGSYSMPSHAHYHNLYEGDHTHSINSATSTYWGDGGSSTTAIYYDQTSTGGIWTGSNYFNGGQNAGFPTDGGRGIDGQRTGYSSGGTQALGGTATGTASGVAGPHLMVNYIIKA